MKLRTPGEEAVSSVLGGVLVFSLVVAFLVVVRVDFTPAWEEDREASMANRVQAEMSAIKSEAERQSGNRTTEEVSLPVTLGERTASKLFSPATLASSLTFDPATATVNITAEQMLLFSRDGQALASIDEAFSNIGSSTTLDNVSSMSHFRLRMTNPFNVIGQNITVTVQDQVGTFQGDFRAFIQDDGTVRKIRTVVRGPTSNTLYEGSTVFMAADNPAIYLIDLLSPDLHFADVLAAADNPYDVVITETAAFSEEFAAVWTESVAGQPVLRGDSGLLVSNFVGNFVSGTLRHDSQPNYFVPQRHLIENGALMIQQDDVTVMRGEPAFDVSVSGGITYIQWTLPAFVGNADSVAEEGTVLAQLDGIQSVQVIGATPLLNITMDSDQPSVWGTFFNRTLANAGLTQGTDFTITVGADSLLISLRGQSALPNVRDVQLQLVQGAVEVDIRN